MREDSHYEIACKGGSSTTYLFSFMLNEKVLVFSSMVTLSCVDALNFPIIFFLDDVAWSILFNPQCFPPPF